VQKICTFNVNEIDCRCTKNKSQSSKYTNFVVVVVVDDVVVNILGVQWRGVNQTPVVVAKEVK
jgi:hypothetical protein